MAPTAAAAPVVDVQVANLGSIWTFYPATRRAELWIRKHTGGETIAEARYAWDIVQGMLDDGMVLLDTQSGRLAQRH